MKLLDRALYEDNGSCIAWIFKSVSGWHILYTHGNQKTIIGPYTHEEDAMSDMLYSFNYEEKIHESANQEAS